MKKLLSVLVVALMANVAMAGAGFQFVGTSPIAVPEGGTVDVLVSTPGGDTGGMSLYLQAIGGFQIVGLQGANFEGGYWQVPSTATYEQIDFYPIGAIDDTSYGVATVGSVGNRVLPADAILAKVTISAAGLGLGATGTLTTDTAVMPSDNAIGTSTQATAGLIVTPEPVTALLLLAGLPLIRRRRA